MGSPCQDARRRTRHPISSITKGYTVGERFPFLWPMILFRSFVLSVTDWPTLRQTTPRTGFDVALELSYRRVDRHSGEGQATTLGDCSALSTKAGHVRTCYGRAGPLLGIRARKCVRVFTKRHVLVCSQHSGQTPGATVEWTVPQRVRTAGNLTQHRARLTNAT